MNVGSRAGDDDPSESVILSSEDSEEKDPNKIYTPVTTILMSFEVKKKKSPRSGYDEDQKLMTIIESEEMSGDQTHNQSQIIEKSR